MTYKERTIIYTGIPKPHWGLALTTVISIFTHIFSYSKFSYFTDAVKTNNRVDDLHKPVNIKVVNNSQPIKQKMIDVAQEETKAPDSSRFKSHQNHIAKKETKTTQESNSINDLDAGDGGANKSVRREQSPSDLMENQRPRDVKIGVGAGIKDPRQQSVYSSLLPRRQDLRASRKAGYQDYIEDELEIGDKIDLTTSAYRYMGYFTGLRKGWSQTWVYPSEAVRRGLQGKVKVEFTIEKGGEINSIKVVETSGYEILDNAVLEALRLSSPYAPLPDGFGKDRLTIVYSFVYRLTRYGAF